MNSYTFILTGDFSADSEEEAREEFVQWATTEGVAECAELTNVVELPRVAPWVRGPEPSGER